MNFFPASMPWVNLRRQLARGIPQTKLCHGCFQTTAPEGLA